MADQSLGGRRQAREMQEQEQKVTEYLTACMQAYRASVDLNISLARAGLDVVEDWSRQIGKSEMPIAGRFGT